jgi:thiamine-phosphate pyrophosphorylase
VRAPPARLLVVTDRHQARRPLPELVADLLDAGVRWVWLRDRDLPGDERRILAASLGAAVRSYPGAALTIGADADLAAETGAVGVHLRSADTVADARRRLGARALIGVSAHTLDDARAAARAGADYVTLSPIFASASKPGYGPALGIAALREARPIGLPVVALGGVTAGTAPACLDAGAAAVAIMGEAMREGAAIFQNEGWLPFRGPATMPVQPIR